MSLNVRLLVRLSPILLVLVLPSPLFFWLLPLFPLFV